MRDLGDGAAGAILGMACGEALGSGGTWTEGTAMALPILRAAAAGEPLTHESTLDEIVHAWLDWSREAEHLGAQTGAVFRGMREASAHAARTAAKVLHDRTGRSAGAGSLLRTVPVALPFVTDAADAGLVRAATRISGLTHADQDATDACVLWSAAIRHAIRAGEFDVRVGLPLVAADRRAIWSERIEEAEAFDPGDFPHTRWAVHAFQAAWSVIVTTPIPAAVPAHHLRLALHAAQAVGATVAAVVGGLLGARWGASAIPAEWRRALHGPAGLDANDLTRLAVLAANGGLGDGTGWPAVDRVRTFGLRVLVPHPHDAGVLLGSLRALEDLPPHIDAVVSLCRTGRRQTDREQVGFWLVDQDGKNPNLDLVLRDAADTVAALRAEGKRVLLHGAEGSSRTPIVGALYAALHLDVPIERALEEVIDALPDGDPQPFLVDAVLRVAPVPVAPVSVPAAASAAPVTVGPASVASAPVQPGSPVSATAAPLRTTVFVDLDATILDVASGIARLPPTARAEYGDHPEAAPGVVALMEPIVGSIDSVVALAAVHDVYLLAGPPWADPVAWQQRLEWVQRYFGRGETVDGRANALWHRLVFAHPRTLDPAATLVGAPGGFGGRTIGFGDDEFPDWAAVRAVLLPPAEPEPRPVAPERLPPRRDDRPAARQLLQDLSRRQARGAARPASDFTDLARR